MTSYDFISYPADPLHLHFGELLLETAQIPDNPGGLCEHCNVTTTCQSSPTCQIYSRYYWPDWKVWVCQVFQIFLSSEKQRDWEFTMIDNPPFFSRELLWGIPSETWWTSFVFLLLYSLFVQARRQLLPFWAHFLQLCFFLTFFWVEKFLAWTWIFLPGHN